MQKPHCRTRSRIEVTVQLVAEVRSALTQFIGSENVQTANWPYLVYDSRPALQHTLKARSDDFSAHFRWEPLHRVESPLTAEEKVDGAKWECSRAVDHAMPFFSQQFFSHLHAILGNSNLYTVEDSKVLEWRAVRQLQSTISVSFPLFASLLHEVVLPLRTERLAVECLSMVELIDKENSVRHPAASASAGLSLGDHWPLLYRAEASRFCSRQSTHVKKRKLSSSMLTNRRHSKRVTKAGLH